MTMLRLWCARASTRSRGLIAVSFVLTTLLLSLLAPVIHKDAVDVLQRPSFNGKQGQSTAGTHVFPNQSGPPSGREYLDVATGSKLHMLLPATKSNVNLCKTLLTLAILGYPAPHIVSWGKEDDAKDLLGGGSHFAKITGVLEYINDEKRRDQQDFDDELVVMIDSYDIWFQLPVEVLIARYRAIVADDDERVARRMGRAFDREDIHANIVFGAGKRCSPNQIHTLACYPIPESPLPMGLHGGNTDTLMGRNQYSSFRTRYLNSGYMMGPIGAMRPLLERAKVKLDECANRTGASFDNGSGASDYCYHGSDQSIFVEMHGEQEFHREVMRRHHRSGMDDYLDRVMPNRAGSRTPPSHIQNAPIEDFLNPAFTHQAASDTYLPDKPFEFGITLDYWSLLGHQTSNAEYDTRYIRHDAALELQVGDQGMFDCPAKAQMPDDLPIEAPGLFLEDAQKNSWRSIPLYTEICVGTVPVMIHHNSVDKWWREAQWDKTWWHGRSRGLLEERRKAGLAQLNEGIPTDAALSMSWEELCPRSVEKELFRDVEDPSPVA